MEINWLDEVDSTNSVANAFLDRADDLTVWSAVRQTAGRGQRGNKWESGAGQNLTFSVLLKPDHLPAMNQFAVSELAALSVLDYLSSRGVAAKIKWPNDIYVEDRKICGILIENKILYDKVSASVVGIGINVNQRTFSAALLNPTSLVLECGSASDYDLKEELSSFMKRFVSLYRGDFLRSDALYGRYISSLYRFREVHYFYDRRGTDLLRPNGLYETKKDCSSEEQSRIFSAQITGVNPSNGCLVISRMPSGETEEFSFKEISYIL